MSQVGARVAGAGCEVSLPVSARGGGALSSPLLSSAPVHSCVLNTSGWMTRGALVSEKETPGVRERSSQYGLGQSGTAAAGGGP